MFVFNYSNIRINFNHKEFQSLFYWMFVFNYSNIRINFNHKEFQSLFYWMFVFNTYETMERDDTKCFNPCFIGCLSLTYLLLSVLFRYYRFNPCFIGCLSLTVNWGDENYKDMAFQSLFYWMFVFNDTNGDEIFEFWVSFQSLFYWMFVFNHKNGGDK